MAKEWNIPLALQWAFIIVFVADFIQVGNQLFECFTINDQTCYTVFGIAYNVGRTQVITVNIQLNWWDEFIIFFRFGGGKRTISFKSLEIIRLSVINHWVNGEYVPLQCFLAKEVAFAQHTNEFLLLWVWQANRNTNSTFWYDEECVATSTLSNLQIVNKKFKFSWFKLYKRGQFWIKIQ